MRKLVLLFLLLSGAAFLPHTASAQTEAVLANVKVQLWPEYDQPSMLVIVDFTVSPDTPLPVELTFRLPLDANLFAVAYDAGEGRLMNAPFSGPTVQGERQAFSMPIERYAMYRFEYYQPLTFTGQRRAFTYVWDGAYAVNEFSAAVQEPLDTASFFMEPAHVSVEQWSTPVYLTGVVRLAKGEPYTINVRYEKTTPVLFRPPAQTLQPVTPLDESTPGRVSLNNYLPFLIGGIGIFLIIGGWFYYWQARSGPSQPARQRKRAPAANASEGTASYCPQCGARAQPGDRFCRTCGARLRRPV